MKPFEQGSSNPLTSDEYAQRVQQEIENYRDDVDVHQLPPIFHYWSNRYIRPWFELAGATHPEDLFACYALKAAKESDVAQPRFLSIGSGNCDAEVAIAKDLVSRGLSNFELTCMDINPHMLERGRELAKNEGVGDLIGFEQADFNYWSPNGKFDAIIANQCLHHVQNLEHLFAAIRSALNPKGLFITSDMIGRNGHQRWPEALAIVQDLWRDLPEKYKYNHQLRRLETEYINHDCSTESFEGIRAQDIMPLLVENFSFHVCLAGGNVIELFVGRSFGHNFDADDPDDRAFIDKVHAIDEQGFKEGTLKPTHLIAVMSHLENPSEKPIIARDLNPKACVRNPDSAG